MFLYYTKNQLVYSNKKCHFPRKISPANSLVVIDYTWADHCDEFEYSRLLQIRKHDSPFTSLCGDAPVCLVYSGILLINYWLGEAVLLTTQRSLDEIELVTAGDTLRLIQWPQISQQDCLSVSHVTQYILHSFRMYMGITKEKHIVNKSVQFKHRLKITNSLKTKYFARYAMAY